MREREREKGKKDTGPEEKSADRVRSEAGHSIPRQSGSPITEKEPLSCDTPFLLLQFPEATDRNLYSHSASKPCENRTEQFLPVLPLSKTIHLNLRTEI